ncbi:MAG: hypothetical protein VX498_15325 [Myxococcota bacterium]|nr:hypothetical protein [Myxococcota bacterium]
MEGPTSGVGIRVACAVIVLVLNSGPSSAAAQSHDLVLCVTGSVPSHSLECRERACDDFYPTWSEALEGASLAVLAWAAPPAVLLCSVEGSGVVHFEDVNVDNIGGALGQPLDMDFGDTILCPSFDLEAGDPVLTMTTDGSDSITALTIDLRFSGPCSSPQGPALAIAGGGELLLEDLHILSPRSFGVGNGLEGDPARVDWSTGTLTGSVGPGVHSTGYFRLGRVEVAGNRVDASSGGRAVVWADGAAASLVLEDTVFFGNLADGVGSEAVALIEGTIERAHRASFIANAMVGGVPLIRLGYSKPGYRMAEGTTLLPTGEQLQDLVFSRNQQIQGVKGAFPSIEPSRLVPLDEASCAGESLEVPYSSRASPWTEALGGEGPLLEVTPTLGSGEIREFVLARSFLVLNELGGAPAIEADARAEGVRIQLLQSTFGDNGPGPALRVIDAHSSSEILALRNLWIDQSAAAPGQESPRSSPWIEISGSPGATFFSMNVSPQESPSWTTEGLTPLSILGPVVHYDDLLLEDPEPWAESSSCERFQRICPGATQTTCLEWLELGKAYPCASDEAIAYLPTQAFVSGLGRPWPWKTDLFSVDDSVDWNEPGATGWSCLGLRGSLDQFMDGDDALWGDGDGHPDALDCDNEDALVVPVLPELDGYNSSVCSAPEDSCYSCPEDSELIPEAGPDSPDNSSVPGQGWYSLEEGCSHRSGCGVAWSCDGGSAGLSLLLLLFPALRRRTSPPRHDRPHRRALCPEKPLAQGLDAGIFPVDPDTTQR